MIEKQRISLYDALNLMQEDVQFHRTQVEQSGVLVDTAAQTSEQVMTKSQCNSWMEDILASTKTSLEELTRRLAQLEMHKSTPGSSRLDCGSDCTSVAVSGPSQPGMLANTGAANHVLSCVGLRVRNFSQLRYLDSVMLKPVVEQKFLLSTCSNDAP